MRDWDEVDDPRNKSIASITPSFDSVRKPQSGCLWVRSSSHLDHPCLISFSMEHVQTVWETEYHRIRTSNLRGWKYFVLKLDSNGNTTTTPPSGGLGLSAAARANGYNSNDFLTIVSRALLADDLFRKRHRIVAVFWFTGWKMPIYVNSHRTL